MEATNGCRCKCPTGESYDAKENECSALADCKAEEIECLPGTSQNPFDCKCYANEMACRKEFPIMEWKQEKKDAEGTCEYREICKIYCEPWTTSNFEECKCDAIKNQRTCIRIGGNEWNEKTKECQKEKV